MALPIVLNQAESGMLLRLVTNYQQGISANANLTPHQIAWCNYILAILTQVTVLNPGDRAIALQLQARLTGYYQQGGQ